MQSLESIAQKIQPGVVIGFEKIGPDPEPVSREGLSSRNLIYLLKKVFYSHIGINTSLHVNYRGGLGYFGCTRCVLSDMMCLHSRDLMTEGYGDRKLLTNSRIIETWLTRLVELRP